MPPKTRVQKCVKIAKNGHFRPFFFGNFRKFSEIPEISGKFSPDFPPDFPAGYPATQSGFLKKPGKFSPEFSPIFRGVFRGIFLRNFRRFLSKKWQKWPKITKILGCVPCSAKRVLQNTRIFPKAGKNFRKFSEISEKFSPKFFSEKFSGKSSVEFSEFSYFPKISPGISPKNDPVFRGSILRCSRETPKKPEKTPRFSPRNFREFPGKFPRGFSGKLPGSVRKPPGFSPEICGENTRFQSEFWRKVPPFFGKVPWEFSAVSLRDVWRKSFPQFSGKLSGKISCQKFFEHSRKFSKSFLINFCGKASHKFSKKKFVKFMYKTFLNIS